VDLSVVSYVVGITTLAIHVHQLDTVDHDMAKIPLTVGWTRDALKTLRWGNCSRCGEPVVFAETYDGYTRKLAPQPETNLLGERRYNKHDCPRRPT